MRVAHFSDLHLLSLEGARAADFLNKRCLGGINLLFNRGRHYKPAVFEALIRDLNAEGADEIVCTGDITNLALPSEFAFARSLFGGLALGAEHVTCIPGNHDTYVANAQGRFEDSFADYCRPDPEWGALWPTVRVRGGLAVIGLSTSQARGWLYSYGEIGPAQLGRLEEALGRLKGLFRLVLVHHPPAGPRAKRKGRGLADHRAFAEVLGRAGAEMVLHGHEHELVEESLPGPGGARIPVRCVTSGSYDGDKPGRMARWRVYELDGTRVVGFRDRVYSPATGAFQK